MRRSLFDLVVPLDRADPLFRGVRENVGYAAARRLMDEIFAGFRDVDGSFVREFQTAGFSARVFELALFAYLEEQGYVLDRSAPAPDFVVGGERITAIEVTTTNPAEDSRLLQPSRPSNLTDTMPEDLDSARRAFVFQIGKALRRKLLKRDASARAYWELPHVADVPFVIAVGAFHDESAQFNPAAFVAEYLYGRRDIVS